MSTATRLRVLVSGGGIAGMAAAYFLERLGAEVTVLERAARFEPLGHYIALKSHGLGVVRRMGLLDACRAREARMDAMRVSTGDGQLLRAGDKSSLDDAVDGYLLFRRADLHAALYEAVRACTELRFGAELSADSSSVRDLGDRVEVDLPMATATATATRTETFDLLLGTDGVHSRTRRLVFGDAGVRPMGGRYIALTVDREHGLTPGTISMYIGCGQNVCLMPTSTQRLSAIVYHGDGGLEPEGRDAPAIKRFLDEAYREFPADVRATISAVDERAYVFMDTITMIDAPAIARGRIALVGDAAHCPTFMSGMGSSLALQGAATLGAALERHRGDVVAALASYARAITPVADGYKASARKGRHFLLRRSRALEVIRNAAIRYTPSWVAAAQAKIFYHARAADPVAH